MKNSVFMCKPGGEMSRDFVLAALDEISSFYRRLYHFPEIKPFSNSDDFDSALQMLNGIREFVLRKTTE